MSRLSSLVPHAEMENLGFGDFNSRTVITTDIDDEITQTEQVFSDIGISGQKIESLQVSKLRAGTLNVDTYIQSTGFVTGTTGWKIEGDGDAEFASITLSGGTVKFGKTSFTDSTNAGYWIGSSGLYIGAASDTTKLKYTLSTGLFDFIGTVSSRSTATLAGSINTAGNLITDIINDALDTNAQDILSAFAFGSGVYDPFSGSSVDGTKWTVFNATYVTESGGTLNMATTAAPMYCGIYSISNFDLTNSWFRVKVVSAGNQALTHYEVCPLLFQKDASNRMWFSISNNTVSALKTIATVQSTVGSVAYNSSTMVYFKIREASGTTYWDYSADNLTWTNLCSCANPWVVTSLRFYIQAGTWDTEASTTLCQFDDASMPTYDSGFQTGNIIWSQTTGEIVSGTGVALTRKGIIGAASGVATFTLNAADGTATFAGALSAPTGTIGGFTIGASTLSATNLSLTSGSSNVANISVGTGSNLAGFNSANASSDIAIWAGDTFANRASAPFFVTAGGAATMTNATITGKFTGNSAWTPIASSTLRCSANTEGTHNTFTYTKKKSIKLGAGVFAGSTGILRIAFDIHSDDIAQTAYGWVYRNGATVGTQQTTTSVTYVNFSEDITGWTAGDTVELWVRADSIVSYRNFRVYYDRSQPDEIVATLDS